MLGSVLGRTFMARFEFSDVQRSNIVVHSTSPYCKVIVPGNCMPASAFKESKFGGPTNRPPLTTSSFAKVVFCLNWSVSGHKLAHSLSNSDGVVTAKLRRPGPRRIQVTANL